MVGCLCPAGHSAAIARAVPAGGQAGGVQLSGVQRRVQRQAGQAARQHVRPAQAAVDIPLQPGAQSLRRADQRNADHPAARRVQPGQQCVQDVLPVHHPAEHHILVGAAVQEIVQQVADVVLHHGLRFRRNHKGVGVPAPVAVQKNAVRQQPLELLAGGRLAHAHGAADQVQRFHAVPSPAAPCSGGAASSAGQRSGGSA